MDENTGSSVGFCRTDLMWFCVKETLMHGFPMKSASRWFLGLPMLFCR